MVGIISSLGWSQGMVPWFKIKTEQDIPYRTVDAQVLKLNIAYPLGEGAFPALVYIYHSWGWMFEGDRAYYLGELTRAARRGYVAVSFDFRNLSVMREGRSRNPFPAQLDDSKALIRWLRANESKYQIDGSRIGALGFSGGGNLALLLGVQSPDSKTPVTEDNSGFSSGVQAVVTMAGVTDLKRFFEDAVKSSNGSFIALTKELLQGTPEEKPDGSDALSPLGLITQDTPPILVIHGDKGVYPQQSILLDQKLTAVGVIHKLLILRGVGHTDQIPQKGKVIFDFLDSILKKTGGAPSPCPWGLKGL